MEGNQISPCCFPVFPGMSEWVIVIPTRASIFAVPHPSLGTHFFPYSRMPSMFGGRGLGLVGRTFIQAQAG